MCITAQDVYQNAEGLQKSGRFNEAAKAYQTACELYRDSGRHNRAICCIIEKTLCLIEPHLQDVTILTESNARNTLRPYLDRMEAEIEKVSKELQNERIRYNSLRRAYLQIEKLYDEYGFIAESSECFRRSMDYKRSLAWIESKPQWLILSISKLFGYGKRVWLLLFWFFGFMLLFGILYWSFKLIEFNNGNTGSPSLFDSIYFTVVVSTTLGFGDIIPACIQGRIVVTCQVIWSYLTLVIISSIIGSRTIRR